MKKIVLSLFVIGTFLIYVYVKQHDVSSYAVVPTTENNTNNSNSVADNNIINDTSNNNSELNNSNTRNILPAQNNTTQTQNNVVPVKKQIVSKIVGMYTDGTYTGNSADAYYGNIKVQAVIKNGKLADVIFLDHPQDRMHSIQVNNYAMPILKQEAIGAQNANVNTVSGASFSSGAFRESLGNALSQAKV